MLATTQPTAPRENTKMENVIQYLQEGRARYEDLLSRLVKVGHRLFDTNTPQEAIAVEKKKEELPDGLLKGCFIEAELLERNNRYFAEIVNKLEGLI